MMKAIWCSLAAVGALIVGLAALGMPASAADSAPAGKVFELRTYTASPGKFDALNARFRDHTCQLLKKHGIEVVGFWTPTTGDEAKNTLIYVCVFSSVEAQTKAWAAFKSDPEWIKAKADSEKDGKLTTEVKSQNLQATDYSPMR
jgi:hypothetical protein